MYNDDLVIVTDITLKLSQVVCDWQTQYKTLISEQPYIHARWSIFTFPGQNEPHPGHGTLWVNSGTIPAILGRLASLRSTVIKKRDKIVIKKCDKIVPPSFKVLRMKKANHIVKQTLYNSVLNFDKK